jgi:ABC-2 type transport system permease protein
VVHHLYLYGLFLGLQLKSYLEYRANFIIGALSTLFMQAGSVAAVWVVMSNVETIQGWGFDEIALMYGLLTVAKSINHMFADNLWTVGRTYIRTGMFDRFMVRPIDPLFHLLADRFCYDGIGNFLVGSSLIVRSAFVLGAGWGPLEWLYLLVMALSGGLIFIALNLITCVSAFWIMDSVPVTRAVFDNHFFAQYPLGIYPRAIGLLLTWAVPYAFASYYPASFLLGRDVGALAWLSPLVAAVLLVIGYRLWSFGLRHYVSTGS